MQLRKKEKSFFLFPIKSVEYLGSKEVNLKEFLKQFLKSNDKIVPFYRASFESELELTNLRGRAPENFNAGDRDRPRKGNKDEQQLEELLFLEGEIIEEDSSLGPDENRRDGALSASFKLFAYSQFQTFHNSKNIEYRCFFIVPEEISNLLETPNLSCLLVDDRLKINYARLGLEFFESGFFGALVGSMPGVKTKFYLEMQDGRVDVRGEERGRQGGGRVLELLDGVRETKH